jgi:hypothetical protein
VVEQRALASVVETASLGSGFETVASATSSTTGATGSVVEQRALASVVETPQGGPGVDLSGG